MKKILFVFVTLSFLSCNESTIVDDTNQSQSTQSTESTQDEINYNNNTDNTESIMSADDVVSKLALTQQDYPLAVAYTTDTYKINVISWLASKSMRLDYLEIKLTPASNNKCMIYGNESFIDMYQWAEYGWYGNFLDYIYCIQDDGLEISIKDAANTLINKKNISLFSNASNEYYNCYHDCDYVDQGYNHGFFDFILKQNQTITLSVFIDNIGLESNTVYFIKTGYLRDQMNYYYNVTETPSN